MHSSIFSGRVSHSRREPLTHTFSFRLFMMYLDLDELDDVFAHRWFWSAKRFALARFRRENYFGAAQVPLDQCVRDLVAERTGQRPQGPIRLLTHLSYFGYSFNPISLYYCFDVGDSWVETIVAEVSNTPWGEKYCYVLADNMNRGAGPARRFETSKKMHVSPFMEMDARYDWLLTEPTDTLVARINVHIDNVLKFNATLALRRQEISGLSLARVLVEYPLQTSRVMFAIHWQALKLWLKGCPVQDHPRKQTSIQASQ